MLKIILVHSFGRYLQIQGGPKVTEGLQYAIISSLIAPFLSISGISLIGIWRLIMEKYTTAQRTQVVKFSINVKGQ